ncbi:hypothetical protein ACFQ4N_15900 [Oceanobacillus iheyensis]|uniref:hypothetical protein n=1 Tax=Oceanobacillus iheyensis TaxID=182710 RepID=UPI003634B7A5
MDFLFLDDLKTLVDDEATVGEKAMAGFFLLPIGKFGKAGKLVKEYDGFKVTSKGEIPAKKSGSVDVNKTTGQKHSDFADRDKLEGHFDKHGKEFGGLYKNADEYLKGAKEVINKGIKVSYEYKGEIRIGYIKFMGNKKNGKAKFEFVGTNNKGDITTYHTQSGKKIWKTINGDNIPVINPLK